VATNKLERIVELHNDGEEAFNGRWDGKDVTIGPGACIEITAGVAEHLIERHPDADLRVEELAPMLKAARNPADPLQQTDRGEAFAAVKGKQKQAAAGE
jgi:hypothetical protein